MENTQLLETIQSAAVEVLRTGDASLKLYLRVRTDGTVEVSRETSWCCSPDEYYKRVPHTLSLEILEGTRNYSSLSENEIEECADNASDAAWELVEGWRTEIESWIEAGNLVAILGGGK